MVESEFAQENKYFFYYKYMRAYDVFLLILMCRFKPRDINIRS